MGVTEPGFELVTRRNCHLCREMEELLERVLTPRGIDCRLRDVDADPALRDRYSDVVPVLLRDGRPVAKVRVEEGQLLRILRRRR